MISPYYLGYVPPAYDFSGGYLPCSPSGGERAALLATIATLHRQLHLQASMLAYQAMRIDQLENEVNKLTELVENQLMRHAILDSEVQAHRERQHRVQVYAVAEKLRLVLAERLFNNCAFPPYCLRNRGQVMKFCDLVEKCRNDAERGRARTLEGLKRHMSESDAEARLDAAVRNTGEAAFRPKAEAAGLQCRGDAYSQFLALQSHEAILTEAKKVDQGPLDALNDLLASVGKTSCQEAHLDLKISPQDFEARIQAAIRAVETLGLQSLWERVTGRDGLGDLRSIYQRAQQRQYFPQ